MLWTSITAVVFSAIALLSQAISAYRRRRRLIVDINVSSFAAPARGDRPERQENWLHIIVSAIGGTFSVRRVRVELPGGATPEPGLSIPDLGPDIQFTQLRTGEAVLEHIADPLQERVTIRDGDQHPWIWRAAGGPGNGVQVEGAWVRARIELTDGKVVRSRWIWLWPDDPTHRPTVPRRPRDAMSVYPKSKGNGVPARLWAGRGRVIPPR